MYVNHNEAISRLRASDPIVLVLNLAVLLGASLVPWPTALVSEALTAGNRADQVGAMVVFAIVTVLISVPWAGLDLYLARHPRLLKTPADVSWMRRHALISAATLLIAVVSVAVAFLSPLLSLVLYLPVFAAFMLTRLLERSA